MAIPSGVDSSPLRAHLAVLRRRFVVVLGVVVVFTTATIGFTSRESPVYEASSRVLLEGTLAEQIVAAGDANTAFQLANLGETEIQVMQSPAIVDAVTAELGHRPDVTIDRIGGSSIVSIVATAQDPATAAADATTFAHVYVRLRKQQQLEQLLEATNQLQSKVSELDAQLTEAQAPLRAIDDEIAASTDPQVIAGLQLRRRGLEDQLGPDVQSLNDRRATYVGQVDRLQLATSTNVTGGAQVVADASEPGSPIAPDPVRSALIAFALSLVIGIGLAFVFEELDDRIRSKSDLERLSGLMVVGLIPSVPSWRKGKEHEVVTVDAENSAAAEAYRSLRTSVQFIGIERPAQVIQITSALPAEGKTTTTANLGVALARAGKRVILVDSDLRRPRLNELFDLSSEHGLTTVLLRETALDDVIVSVPDEPRLSLLASGQVPPNPAELPTVAGYSDAITALRARADYVIMDTPPVLPVADARVISALVDMTILVVAANASSQQDVRRALELLEQVQAPLVGVVLNDIPRTGRQGHPYSYWYSYGARSTQRRRFRPRGRAAATSTIPRVDVDDLTSTVTTSE